jgi:Response regulator containing CheY-like receiver, AAA-type ATPase, and DNA-binding domains
MSRFILHIEKEEPVKAMLSALLQARGHHVDQTASGKDALLKAKEKTYDLVIVGDELEDIDGIGLIVKLRGETTPCPIILSPAAGEMVASISSSRKTSRWI